MFFVHILFVAQYYGTAYMIVGCGDKLIERTMYLVVLTRLHFYRQHRKVIVVVDKEIYLTTLFIVVIV